MIIGATKQQTQTVLVAAVESMPKMHDESRSYSFHCFLASSFLVKKIVNRVATCIDQTKLR